MVASRLFILICFLALGQSAFAEKTINITTGEYAPWTSAALNHNGFTSHIISEAFKLEGYEVEFTFYPWKRAFDSARSGEQFHATSYWYPSEERAKDFHYSDPIQVDATVFFYMKDKPPPDWETLDDLRRYTLFQTEFISGNYEP